MVNVANIDKMIDAISKQADPIYMGTFVRNNSECGTTACLAGWANILRLGEQGKGGNYQFDSTYDAAEWMGLEQSKANDLFYDYRADDLPDKERKAATIALLTKLRDTGEARWRDVIPDDSDY